MQEERIVAFALRRRDVARPVVDRDLPQPCLLRELKELGVASLAVRPQHSLDRNRVAGQRHCLAAVETVVFCKRGRYARIGRCVVFRLHRPEEDDHRPHFHASDNLMLLLLSVPEAFVPEIAFWGRMVESVVDAGLALLDQRFVAGRVAEAENPVGVVGGLLVPPPARAVFAHARYRPRPETRVVRIAQGLRMPGEAVGLHAAGAQKPTCGTRLRQHAVFEFGERSHGATCRCGNHRKESKRGFCFFGSHVFIPLLNRHGNIIHSTTARSA